MVASFHQGLSKGTAAKSRGEQLKAALRVGADRGWEAGERQWPLAVPGVVVDTVGWAGRAEPLRFLRPGWFTKTWPRAERPKTDSHCCTSREGSQGFGAQRRQHHRLRDVLCIYL